MEYNGIFHCHIIKGKTSRYTLTKQMKNDYTKAHFCVCNYVEILCLDAHSEKGGGDVAAREEPPTTCISYIKLLMGCLCNCSENASGTITVIICNHTTNYLQGPYKI